MSCTLCSEIIVHFAPKYSLCCNSFLFFKKECNKLFLLLCFLFNSIIFYSQSIKQQQVIIDTIKNNENCIKDKKPKLIYFVGNVGLEFYNWAPETRENGYIDFATEGLNTFNTSFHLGLFDKDFFSINYEGTFSNNSNQQEMLKADNSFNSSISFLSCMAKSKPFVHKYITCDSRFCRILKNVLAYKYVYTQELYWGEATMNQNAYFIPIDFNSSLNTQPKEDFLFNKDSKVAFKTLFRDNEYSINLETNKNYDIVLGYFQSSWERPSDYYTYRTPNNEPIIMGYRYQSNGFIIGYQSDNFSKLGLHLDFQIRGAGLSNKSVKSSFGDLSDIFKEKDNSGLNYSAIYIAPWYNYQVKKLFVTLGAQYSIRTWTRVFENSESVAIDIDYFLKVYLKFNFKY